MINKSISALKNANKNKEIVLVRFTQNATGCIMNKHTGLGKIGDLLILFIKLKKQARKQTIKEVLETEVQVSNTVVEQNLKSPFQYVQKWLGLQLAFGQQCTIREHR